MKTTRLGITVTISLGLFALNHVAFAEDTASFAKIDVTYHPSTNVLEITGIVYKTFSQNYVLTIFNPEGRLVEVSQLQLSQDGTFSQSILTSNTLWSEPGNYTAKLTSAPQVLSEKLFYFPGTSCCIKNSHGVQAGTSKTPSSIDSPLKQFKSGIAVNDVVCRADLKLVVRSEDGSPACVTPDTANILRERGWATNVMMNHGPPMTPFGPRTPLHGNVTNTKTSINTTNSFQIKNRTATFDLQINPNLRGYAGRYTTDMIAVVRGDIIAWENSDSIPHTITSTNGAFDSGTISTGSKFTLDTTPLVAGYYDYYDKFNNTLTGSIRIIDPRIYNDSEIINMAKQLNATKLFFEKYPNASVKVEHKYYDSVNFEAEKINNINSEQSRTLQLEITFDKNDTGVMKISLGCLGHISTYTNNVTENIESSWCLTHLG